MNYYLERVLPKILLLLICLSLSITGIGKIDSIINIIAVAYLIYFFREKISLNIFFSFKHSVLIAYGVFLGSIIIASVLTLDPLNIKIALNYFYYSLQFFIVYLLVKITSDDKFAMLGFMSGLFFICSFALYDYFLNGKDRLGVLFGGPNYDASVIEMLLPICFINVMFCSIAEKYSYRKIAINFTIVMLGIVALYFTKSRGAILGFVLGGMISYGIYCYKNYGISSFLKKFLVSIFLVILGVGLLVNINNGTISRSYDNERVLLLKSSYHMWNDNKIYGVGLTRWQEEYKSKYISPEAKEPHLSFPHNIYAYYFSTTGVIGGVGYLLFLCMIIKYLVDNLNCSYKGSLICLMMLWVLISISLHGLVDSGLVLKKCYKLFCGMLGMTVASIQFNSDLLGKSNIKKSSFLCVKK